MCEPAYLHWCQQQGVVLRGVAPAFVAQGWRGIVATRRLAPGDTVARVPQALLMSVLSAREGDARLAEQLQDQQLSSHQVLTLHLLHEASKGSAGSFWGPYIQQLPRQYATLIAWPPAAVEALQLPHAQDAAAAATHKARCEWQAARPVLKALGVDKKWTTWRAWVWAASTVLSRTMYHPGDPAGCGCLTPLADLHNYSPPPLPFTPNLARDMQQLLGQRELSAAQQPSPAPQQQQQPASQDQLQQQPEDSTPSGGGDAPGGPGQAAAEQAQAGSTPDSPALPSSAAAGGAVCFDDPQPPDAAEAGEAAAPVATAVGATEAAAEAPDEPATAVSSDDAANEADTEAAASISGDGHFAEGVYNIVVRRSYKPGEQVFLCYGRHTNLELLELYGFTLADTPPNPHDTAVLPLELLQQQLQHALDAQLRQAALQHCRQLSPARGKQSGWRAVRIDIAPADCWVHPNGQPSWQLLSALRLAAATPAEAKALGFKAHAGQPISLDSELLVLAALVGACRAHLAGLPTSAAEDEQLLTKADCNETRAASERLQDSTSGGCRCNAAECEGLALSWRLAYKACLGECVHRCDEAAAAAVT